ncbi:MAG: transcriptional repressor LexA [Bdellovibrio sp.]|nr:transcriptional repressor LexA [Bdellovibrio sp.]
MKKLNSPLPSLSAKEKAVLQFIETELLSKGISPSYQEICDHFGFASFNSVQNYLKQLSTKGYLLIPQNQKRAIQILHSAGDFHKDLIERLQVPAEPSRVPFGQSSPSYEDHSKVLPIPFLGRVAAGQPIERITENEFIDIPRNLIKSAKDLFALRVEGDSMIEEGIFDGDTLVIQSRKEARDGDLVVASVEEEATVKRYFHKANPATPELGKLIELRPANKRLTSMWYSASQVEIKGLVRALMRSY